jgi:hypothetical protein
MSATLPLLSVIEATAILTRVDTYNEISLKQGRKGEA